MVDVNRARQSVETCSAPIPQFEGKDVGCCADLENHGVLAGTVDCAGGDEKVVVLARGPGVHERFNWKWQLDRLRIAELLQKHIGFDSFLKTKVDTGTFCRIEQIVAFVLRIGHAEFFLYVVAERMNLQ